MPATSLPPCPDPLGINLLFFPAAVSNPPTSTPTHWREGRAESNPSCMIVYEGATSPCVVAPPPGRPPRCLPGSQKPCQSHFHSFGNSAQAERTWTHHRLSDVGHFPTLRSTSRVGSSCESGKASNKGVRNAGGATRGRSRGRRIADHGRGS